VKVCLREGESIPWYYGVGFVEFNSHVAHCYICPFYLVVRLAAEIRDKYYIWKNKGEKFYPPSPYQLQKEYDRGRKDGEEHVAQLVKLIFDCQFGNKK
jgi:hypothetical protein